MLEFIRRFSTDTRGQMLILFALLLPALAGTVGMAVDLGRAFSNRQSLSAAADAAVLAAARGAASVTTSTAAGVVTAATSTGKALGQAAWTANTSTVPGASLTLNLTYSGGTWVATAVYSANVSSTFAGVLGVKTISVSGTSTASAGIDLKSYTNIYMLLDISQSMALPSTTAGVNYLQMISPACEFACHVPFLDLNFKLLRSKGYPMRIDTLQDAASDIVSSVVASGSTTTSIATYTFNDKVTKVSGLTNNFSSLQSSIGSVDVATYDDGTQFDDAMAKMNTEISAGGNGKTSSTPQAFLFVVTDGVQDGIYTSYNPPSSLRLNSIGGQVATINPAACDTLKAKNVKVGILYTTYMPSKNLGLYDLLIKPRAGNIPIALKACASEGLFFEASDHDGIKAAMAQMYATALSMNSPPRLTN